jgi:S-adenosylmethionine:tRNA ribosyltransferase-isomerase
MITFAPMREHPENLSISDYTYTLPEDRIAQHPLEQRDASKLLVYKEGTITDEQFADLAQHIPSGALLVFNATRVVRARLLMRRNTGGLVEIFCTDAADASMDFTRLLQSAGSAEVLAFVGNSKRWKPEEELVLDFAAGQLHAQKTASAGDQWKVKLWWTPAELTFAEILEATGKIPLPPYMHRDEESTDAERYQTIFAAMPGSVAAPTASLHFTDAVLKSLQEKNVTTAQVTLHVGAGTFQPVKSETMRGHDMHREQVIIPKQVIEQLLSHRDMVIAAGTTALRTLESIYWFGRQLVLAPGEFRSSLYTGQWEPYENGPDVPARVALQAILDWMNEYHHTSLTGYTQLLIAPGYRFRIVNGLITNFHQPQSTLLLLVAAFTGEDFRKIYQHALDHNYRFLSYGDSSLLFRND